MQTYAASTRFDMDPHGDQASSSSSSSSSLSPVYVRVRRGSSSGAPHSLHRVRSTPNIVHITVSRSPLPQGDVPTPPCELEEAIHQTCSNRAEESDSEELCPPPYACVDPLLTEPTRVSSSRAHTARTLLTFSAALAIIHGLSLCSCHRAAPGPTPRDALVPRKGNLWRLVRPATCRAQAREAPRAPRRDPRCLAPPRHRHPQGSCPGPAPAAALFQPAQAHGPRVQRSRRPPAPLKLIPICPPPLTHRSHQTSQSLSLALSLSLSHSLSLSIRLDLPPVLYSSCLIVPR